MLTFFRRGVSVIWLTAFISIIFASNISAQNMFRKVSDYDGDGKADFAVTRVDNGMKAWWIWQTTAGLRVAYWGLPLDRNAASDYDGDGKTDLAVWTPPTTNGNSSTFSILESSTNTLNQKSFFNFIVSSMQQQDYNGDGKTDTAVLTGHGPSYTLSVIYSGSGSGFSEIIFGGGLRIGDMDGDGRAEISSYTGDSNNLLTVTMKNHVTGASRSVRFGLVNDRFQMADFDGDSIGDLTIWRPTDGTWWWIRSSDNVVNVATWGIDSDTPVPADYDGDGKTDLAVYRRGSVQSPQSYYWINGSLTGIKIFPWGTTTDLAVAY